MALSIKNPKADKLVAEIAKATGESKTQAIIVALEERLERLKGRRKPQTTAEELMEIGRRCAALPILDPRTPDEILGYNEIGTFD